MPMIKTKLLLIFIVCAVITSCHTQKQGSNSKDFTIPSEFEGYDVTLKSNCAVLTKENTPTAKYPEKLLDLVIIDTTTSEVLLKDQLKSGKLEWIDESNLKISYTPGNPEKGKNYYFFFDLKTKSKYTNSHL